MRSTPTRNPPESTTATVTTMPRSRAALTALAMISRDSSLLRPTPILYSYRTPVRFANIPGSPAVRLREATTMTDDLRDRVVVISGASSGIGLATVSACLQAGASVVAGDLRPSGLRRDDTVGPGRLGFVTVDLSEPEGPSVLIEAALDRHGQVDVLVNNVGMAPYRTSFLDVTDEDWLATLNLNVMAAVRASRAVLPSMVARGGGVIISLASDAGRQPDPFFVDYALSKAAVLSLSKSISIEFGPSG